MAVDDPPRSGGNGAKAFIKKHKVLVYGGGVLGGFFYLSKRGGGGGGSVSDSGTPTSPITSVEGASDVGDRIPVSDPVSPGGSGASTGDTVDQPADSSGDTPNPTDGGGTTIIVNVPEQGTPEETAPVARQDTTATNTAAQGATIGGKFFAGATGNRMTGSGSNQYGKYMIHVINFPGREEVWWHYTSGSSAGKWTGPHNSGVASGATPAKKPAVVVNHPSGGGSSGSSSSGSSGSPSGGKEQPKSEANVFYNADRNLRYIIKKHDNHKNYKHYESKLNKGDWGKGGVIPQ